MDNYHNVANMIGSDFCLQVKNSLFGCTVHFLEIM